MVVFSFHHILFYLNIGLELIKVSLPYLLRDMEMPQAVWYDHLASGRVTNYRRPVGNDYLLNWMIFISKDGFSTAYFISDLCLTFALFRAFIPCAAVAAVLLFTVPFSF